MADKDFMDAIKGELPYLIEHFGVKRIGLFGSFARGTPEADSDIDILVDFGKPVGFRFMDLADYLEQVLGRKVDILTPEGIRSIRIKEVAQEIERSIVYV